MAVFLVHLVSLEFNKALVLGRDKLVGVSNRVTLEECLLQFKDVPEVNLGRKEIG